jgi:heat-inducible transcriptional repressor
VRENVHESAASPPGGREAAVLEALLEVFWSTGAPVGSRTLAERMPQGGCSATIRHLLGELEAAGFLQQPHTSAGRVPTPKAIRWWLQRLGAPVRLIGEAEVQRLERALRESADEATLWQRASDFLSELSSQVGLVAVCPWRDTGLKQLRFFHLTGRRVLAILVAVDGRVRERVSLVPEPYTQAELDAAGNYFNQRFSGWSLARIRRELLLRLEEERAAYNALLKRVLVLAHCGVLELEDAGEVYLQGAGHLSASLQGETLGDALETLNQKERWLQLLTGMDEDDPSTIAWDTGGLGPRCWTRVRVDLEDQHLPQLALIAANSSQGAVGILGPTRMEYPRALAAVSLVRDACNRILEGDTA